MPTYRKRPVEVEAFLWTGETHKPAVDENSEPEQIVPDWFMEAVNSRKVELGGGSLFVNTLEGNLFAEANTYIVKGIQGEVYPVKKDIFELTYEPV